MKTKLPLIAAAYCALCTVGSAFTLDFVGFLGTSLPPDPLTIAIPGYGDVVFEAGSNSTLVVDEAYKHDNGFGAPSLSSDQNEAVKVTFKCAQHQNLDFEFVGVSASESFTVQPDLFTEKSYLVNLKGSGDDTGIINWNAVPEPTASLIGALGAAMLVICRRR